VERSLPETVVPSQFFISGFSDSEQQPPVPQSSLQVRGNELRYIARLELNRFEFGLQDRAQGKDSQAARDIARALEQAGKLSHPRAKQRVLSYMPREGQEHCPHCWVFMGNKHPLFFETSAPEALAESASCKECGSQYQVPKA
jgi:hypothetical protein